MNVNTFFYLCGQGFGNFTRNKVGTVLSLLITTISIFIISLFALSALNFSSLLRHVKQKTSFIVYLADSVPPAELAELRRYLETQAIVKSVEYFSKNDALNELRETSADLPELVEALPENPLPAYFAVRLNFLDPDSLKDIIAHVKTFNNIENIDYSEKNVQFLLKISRLVNLGVLITGIIICLFIIFIVFHTIKLTIFSREREIDILKLVGATPFFIRIPFILEGFMQGVVASSSALGLVFAVYTTVFTRIQFLPLFDVAFRFFSPVHIAIIIGGGIIVCIAGSFAAVEDFLDIGREHEDD